MFSVKHLISILKKKTNFPLVSSMTSLDQAWKTILGLNIFQINLARKQVINTLSYFLKFVLPYFSLASKSKATLSTVLTKAAYKRKHLMRGFLSFKGLIHEHHSEE